MVLFGARDAHYPGLHFVVPYKLGRPGKGWFAGYSTDLPLDSWFLYNEYQVDRIG